MWTNPLLDRLDSDDVDVLWQILKVATNVHGAQGGRETLERFVDGFLDVVDDQSNFAAARLPQESAFPSGLCDLLDQAPAYEFFREHGA